MVCYHKDFLSEATLETNYAIFFRLMIPDSYSHH